MPVKGLPGHVEGGMPSTRQPRTRPFKDTSYVCSLESVAYMREMKELPPHPPHVRLESTGLTLLPRTLEWSVEPRGPTLLLFALRRSTGRHRQTRREQAGPLLGPEVTDDEMIPLDLDSTPPLLPTGITQRPQGILVASEAEGGSPVGFPSGCDRQARPECDSCPGAVVAVAHLLTATACQDANYGALLQDACLAQFQADMEVLGETLWCDWGKTVG
ncbi:Receptor activity-modifying protein 1 [Camelus dromedarius]|uniref:Receptor activity-modifying protein 1 n=1 Tax=Camelus dromedarius TaxID=9838 RepID=A0A5N4E515_CAMDR|nr:Receptor activity-modifying protein 1 [Camelus dromedarius]